MVDGGREEDGWASERGRKRRDAQIGPPGRCTGGLLHDVLAETGSTLLHVENATSFGLAQRMKVHTRPHSLLRIPPLQASTLHRSRYLPFATQTRAQDAFAASQPRQECAKP
jgi:hypothetical protein